jgi:hypothetical protein
MIWIGISLLSTKGRGSLSVKSKCYGPRINVPCLMDRSLAWCELWVLLANLFRRYYVEPLPADMRWRDLILVKYDTNAMAWVIIVSIAIWRQKLETGRFRTVMCRYLQRSPGGQAALLSGVEMVK